MKILCEPFALEAAPQTAGYTFPVKLLLDVAPIGQ